MCPKLAWGTVHPFAEHFKLSECVCAVADRHNGDRSSAVAALQAINVCRVELRFTVGGNVALQRVTPPG